MNTKIAFFKESIKSFKTTGAIAPSSKLLVKRMLNEIDFNNTSVIVELGSGNGIITKSILNRMNKDTVLLCFEINPKFYNHLNQINDDRLIVINQSAENINEVLKQHNISNTDCVISSLPLTLLPFETAKNILKNSRQALKNNGIFIQYQYSMNFRKVFKQVFGKNNVSFKFEFMNFPPAFIYICKNLHITP